MLFSHAIVFGIKKRKKLKNKNKSAIYSIVNKIISRQKTKNGAKRREKKINNLRMELIHLANDISRRKGKTVACDQFKSKLKFINVSVRPRTTHGNEKLHKISDR